jgi:NADH-quinone oxidoreductase subunit L
VADPEAAASMIAFWGWMVLLCPLVGMALVGLGWRLLPGRTAGWLASLAVLASFGASIGALLALLAVSPDTRRVESSLFTYVQTAGLDVNLGILVDPLSVFMCLVVSGVSFLIHVYSVSYMASDRGYARYFAYLNYFVFSMLLLVLAGNFVLLIVGWAFVGAASYLLISFWYRRPTAVSAGIKAFVMNVIGDVGLVIAAFLLFSATGSLEYGGVFVAAPRVFAPDDGVLVAACLMLLVGAFAKSGQLPLHTWLPDAMEGPSPVSALIHAATMVTAGVYLIARMHPLFELAPSAALVGAIIGTATLVFAATVALVQTDLKRIIAYSTISQIGYMVLGVCAFAYSAGLFHLMTHAFFKALLFMAAGSAVAALGATNASIDRMGGLRFAMPFTHVTFAIGAFALAGFPLFSGFFSKDEILSVAHARGGVYEVLAIFGYVGALLTAFYAFRMVFRVFWGEAVPEALVIERGDHVHASDGDPDADVGLPGPDHHIAEREGTMKFAMGTLAVLALVGGAVGVPGLTETLETFLEPSFAGSEYLGQQPSHAAEWVGLAVGGVLAVVGVAAAYVVYVSRPGLAGRAQERLSGVHRFLYRRWYFDELYHALFVRPGAGLGRFSRSVVETVLVQGLFVGGTSSAVRAGSSLARAVQSGYLRGYALLLFAGLGGLGLYFLVVAG